MSNKVFWLLIHPALVGTLMALIMAIVGPMVSWLLAVAIIIPIYFLAHWQFKHYYIGRKSK